MIKKYEFLNMKFKKNNNLFKQNIFINKKEGDLRC